MGAQISVPGTGNGLARPPSHNEFSFSFNPCKLHSCHWGAAEHKVKQGQAPKMTQVHQSSGSGNCSPNPLSLLSMKYCWCPAVGFSSLFSNSTLHISCVWIISLEPQVIRLGNSHNGQGAEVTPLWWAQGIKGFLGFHSHVRDCGGIIQG